MRLSLQASNNDHSPKPPAPVRVVIFDAGRAQPGSSTLACPGMPRFPLPALTRKTLPRGLTLRAFRRAAVVGVRVTLGDDRVVNARQLPHIAGAGLVAD